MPEEFRPEWEYWEPDAEVEAVLWHERQNDRTFGGLLGDVPYGFRFGWGAKALGKLPSLDGCGRAKRIPAPAAARVCPCGEAFVPRRGEQRHCGSACAAGAGRDARWDRAWAGGRAEQIARVIAMRTAGVSSLAEIAAAVGANLHTVNRWLRKAGLTVHGKGRPGRRKAGTTNKRRATDGGQTDGEPGADQRRGAGDPHRAGHHGHGGVVEARAVPAGGRGSEGGEDPSGRARQAERGGQEP